MSTMAPSGPEREKKAGNSPPEIQTNVLQFILDSMGDGVTVVDEHGRFVLCNRSAERIAGIDSLHATAAEWSRTRDICLPDGFTRYPADQLPLVRALRGETVESAELFVQHPGAPEGKWMCVTARPFTDENGTVKGAIALYRDVTERRSAEQALRASEARYRVLFEKNLAGILLTTLDGHVLQCNEAFARMLGYGSSAEVTALQSQDFYFHPEDRPEIVER